MTALTHCSTKKKWPGEHPFGDSGPEFALDSKIKSLVGIPLAYHSLTGCSSQFKERTWPIKLPSPSREKPPFSFGLARSWAVGLRTAQQVGDCRRMKLHDVWRRLQPATST